MAAALPSHPHLDHLKKQAKDLLKSFQAGDGDVCTTLQKHLPRFAESSPKKSSPRRHHHQWNKLHLAQYLGRG